jgi:hypothetical protein
MTEPRLISVAVNWSALGKLFPQFLPAWLMSLVVHLSLVLVLALLHVVSSGSWHGGALMVEAGGTDGLGSEGEGLLAESLALPSELGLGKVDESGSQPVAGATEELIDAPALALSDVALGGLGLGGLLVGGAPTGDGAAGSEGAAGHGDGPAHTEVFGLAGEGRHFVYVFDRSESMNSVLSYTSEGATVFSVTPLEAAKAELLNSLKDLEGRHRFHIVFYNHEPWLFDPGQSTSRLVQATPENKRRAAAFVKSVYGQGNTNHLRPLEIALGMRPDVIFLLTDGEAKDDPTPRQLQQIRKLNGDRTRINVVQFCYGQRLDTSLVQLANDNGGKHLFIDISRLGPGARGMARMPR